MKDIQFPIFKTKTEGVTQKFDLTDPGQRQDYFRLKAGKEIKELQEFLKKGNTFIAYLLGKKNSGKGTYAKMFQEVIDKKRIEHFSIGDMVREFDEVVRDKKKKKELVSFLEKNYRGYLSLRETISALKERSTETLLPSELILALVKRKIGELGRKALFIDGFPRDLDQISYSLFFRDLIGYRDDPDVFVLIDVPRKVIEERRKSRRVCPLCQTSRNLKLLPTKKVVYDRKEKKFYLICDNPHCRGHRMLPKEGDELGVESVRERLEKDERLIKKAFSLYGIPKVLLRNSIPAEKAKEFIDDYEITPTYSYKFSEKDEKVKITRKPWQVSDDQGILSYSLLAPAVVVSLIKQMKEVLGL